MMRLRWFVLGLFIASALPLAAQQGGVTFPLSIQPANLGGFYPSTGGASGTVLAGAGVGSPATFTPSPTGLTSVGATTFTGTNYTVSGSSGTFVGPSAQITVIQNGATAQLLGAANSYTSASNYEALLLDGNGRRINMLSVGGPAQGAFSLAASGTNYQTWSATSPFKVSQYALVNTAGWGQPAIYGYGGSDAVTNTGTASIATYTVGAADGTFQVGCNILVTTSTNHTFSCDVVYTDTAGNPRTMVLPVTVLAGTFATTGLITNITGVGPYTSTVMTIRADATTSITVRTSAGGTFVGVVYNPYAFIAQVG